MSNERLLRILENGNAVHRNGFLVHFAQPNLVTRSHEALALNIARLNASQNTWYLVMSVRHLHGEGSRIVVEGCLHNLNIEGIVAR